VPSDPRTGHGNTAEDLRDLRDVRLELDAERAAVEHWRRIARRRTDDYAALRNRTSVRLLLGLERRARPVVARAGSARRRVGAAAERLALTAGALGRGRRRRLLSPRGPMPPSPPPGRTRRLGIVVVGSDEPRWSHALDAVGEVVRVTAPSGARVGLAEVIASAAPDVVGIVHAASEALTPDWVERLVAPIDGSTVAAVPLLVHPRRPLERATAHDGLVRAAGVELHLDGDGTPVGRVVLVPDAVVVDHRPVRSRRDLRFAVDPGGAAWAAAIDRSGAVLRQVADRRAEPTLRFAITVAAPSSKVAARWGDWHLAQALADGLRQLGHAVRVQTADHADDPAGRACDVHLVVRGLQPVRRTAGQRHVLWIISHPEAIDDDELEAADLVLVASPRFADHLRRRTATPVEVMLQATDHRRFRLRPVDPAHRHDVTVVAKTRDVLRPVVFDALAAGVRPAIYGAGWHGLVDPDLIVADHVDNEDLPVVYSSAGVVLADHWRTMRAWGFVSNRLFDVLACGTAIVSDPVEGIDDLFDGAVREYHSPDELRALVDDVLGDPEAATRRVERRKLVLANHTFDHRARQLVDCLQQVASASRR
jgi:hypothetical protein